MAPLQDLLRCLQEAIHTTHPSETISIPRNIVNSVLQLSPLQVFPDIDRLVELFDGLYEGNCSRLDVSTFQCILYVLLGGHWGLSQERGLCLFLSSIRHLPDGSSEADQSTAVSISSQSKSAIGRKTLQLCLTHFTDTSGPEVPRRWSGRLLLELLRGSADNRELLASGPEESRGLGKLVLRGSDYALRFIAANVIREMVSAQLDPEIFWPLGSNPKLVTTFPSGRLADSGWIEDFYSFINEADKEISGDKIQSGQYMHIALSITTGDSSYPPSGLSLALVMSSYVTLVHAATKAVSDTASQFVDIMLDNIERCSHAGEDHSAINLELVKHGTGSYVRGGLALNPDKFSLIFSNGEQAGKFLSAIEREAPHLTGAQLFQDTGAKERHISAAYVALAGTSSPSSISPSVLPIFHSTPRGKENARAPRVASFAILPLPSQEEVVARSSALLDAQLSRINDAVPTWASDNSTALDDCPGLIESSSMSGKQNDPRELENVENGDDHVSPTSDKLVVPKTEKHSTAGCSRDTRLEETKIDNEVQAAFSWVANSDGSMRLQQSEGPDPYSGLPSPVHQTPHPSFQDNVLLQISTSPGHGPSLGSRSPQFGNGDVNCSTKPGVDSVEIRDSQQDGTNSNDAQRENNMASVDSIPPTEMQQPSNAGNTSITPAETVSISRLKRPRQKIIGLGVKSEAMDWDQDLRVSDHERNVPSNKKPKTSPRKVPMRTKAKNSPATKSNRQAKAMPKTPKMETPATIKEPKMARKRPPTKTLTSSRQRRAAATKANETIANTKYDDSDNFDVDDPIETTSPEPSSLETPVIKPAMSKKFPRAGKIEPSNPLAPESVCNGDEHGPIILHSPMGDEVAAVHQSLDKLPTSPTANEALVLDTSVSDLDAALLCCVDSQPSLQGVDTPPCINDILATAKGISPRQSTSSDPPDGIIPACITERTNTEEIEAIGTGKQTFAKKLSLALLGTGIHAADNFRSSRDEIMHIEECSPIPEFDFANATTLPRRENVSHVSQKVAEFMSRKPKTGKLPLDINDNGLMANPLTQNLENCNLNGNDNSVKGPNTPNYQALTKAHRFSETTSTGKGPNLSCPVPPPGGANLSDITTEKDQPNQALKSPLIDERTHRKAQIVSFDIDGPRNQCLSSIKKPSVRHLKPITPILKEPRKSMILKRKASVQKEERGSPKQEDEDVLPTPNAKRQMTEPTTEKPDTFTHEDISSIRDLLRSERLPQNRPTQLLGSQQSMVDLNGSPRRVTRVSWDSQMTRVQAKEVMKDERKQECAAEPNLIGPRNHNLTGKSNVQVQSFEEERGSDEENIEPADSDSVPGQDEVVKEKEEGACKPLGPNGSRFSFQRSKSSAKTPLQELQSKHAISSTQRDMKLSRFIDSLASHPKTTGGSLDVHSEAETELADDDTDGASSYSTDSIPSHSSDTLVHPDINADAEWRDTLRATQKTTLDILLDTSKRLVRHLVDEETAITDLVTIYQNSCAKLLEQLQKSHDENFEERERQMQPLKKNLRAVYEGANRRLNASRERIQKLPTTKEFFSGVRKRKGLVSRFDDVMNGYGVETDC